MCKQILAWLALIHLISSQLSGINNKISGSCLGHSDAASDAALADVAPGGAHIALVLVIRQLSERHPDKRQHKNTRQLQEYYIICIPALQHHNIRVSDPHWFNADPIPAFFPVLRIRDVYPGSQIQGLKDYRIPDPDPHLHQRI
jgi:hypothetical protein